MNKKAFGFPFLDILERPPKPRSLWVTVMSDAGMPPGYQRDFLRMTSDIIDYAKFIDHPGNMAGYPAELIQEKIDIYNEHGIPSFLGGIPFEVAAMQGKVSEYFKRVAEMGFKAVEISEDVIPKPLSPSQREGFIKQAKDLGLEVFTELGRKFPDAPLERGEIVESALSDLKAGAKKVVIENSDLVKLQNEDPAFFADVSREVGKEHLIFEAGPAQWPSLAAWLIQSIGPDVNIENISDKEIITLDAMRRQLHRNVEYAFFHENRA
ncbi:MAG: phosphosulfolactate synthase [Deltaproteobacteria bacterium]|nr:phosphosulfolactate synthase [Deltaproteobacteria bacterium]MBW2308117.1 phosphosulfolactate synthase [Deltaproteobacteria bacterium]